MTNKPKIILIAAMDEGRAIGKNNKLLFDIPEDMAHFKAVTLGHPVIMGLNTYNSIGRPLPNRTNIILSSKDVKIEGCITAHTLEEAFEIGAEHDSEEIFVIGGGMVYAAALPFADKLDITLVEGKHEAEVFFPEYEKLFTKVISEESHDDGKYKFKFLELEK